MSFLDDDIAEIKAMIAEEGDATCLWQGQAFAPTDPNKPWKGSSNNPTFTRVAIVFVDALTAQALVNAWGKGFDFADVTAFGIMGAYAFSPAIEDRVLRDGKDDLVVKQIATAAPASVPLFHLIGFDG